MMITRGSISMPHSFQHWSLDHLRCDGAPVDAEDDDFVDQAASPTHGQCISIGDPGRVLNQTHRRRMYVFSLERYQQRTTIIDISTTMPRTQLAV